MIQRPYFIEQKCFGHVNLGLKSGFPKKVTRKIHQLWSQFLRISLATLKPIFANEVSLDSYSQTVFNTTDSRETWNGAWKSLAYHDSDYSGFSFHRNVRYFFQYLLLQQFTTSSLLPHFYSKIRETSIFGWN